MNCRSRPTCSSILRAASLPSQRFTVWVITAVSSSPYRVTAKTTRSAARPVQPGPRSRSSPWSRSPKAVSSAWARRRSGPSGVVEGLHQRPPERVPQRRRGDHQLRVGQHPALEPLHALLGRRVVQQVVGELGERAVECSPGVVVGVAADVLDPVDRLEVQPVGDLLVERRGRPPGGALAEDLDEGLLVQGQPAVRLVEDQVDQAVVRPVPDDLLQQAPGDRADRLGEEPRQQRLLDQRDHVGVTDPRQGHVQHRGGLVGDPARVVLGAEPGAEAAAEAGRVDPLADHGLVQEVLADELLEAAAELLLAPRDQRGVRDRQARAGAGTAR